MYKYLSTAALAILAMPVACAGPSADPMRDIPETGPVLATPADAQTRDMVLHVGRDIYTGKAYIVSASVQEVSTALRARSYFSRSFRQHSDTQPTLGDMEREWTKVYGHFHPEKSAIAFAQHLAAIDAAATAGVIAPEEKSRWRAHVEQLSPSDLDSAAAAFTDLAVERLTFSSSHSDTARRRTGEKHVVLIDLSKLTSTPSQTLLWYAEQRMEQRRVKWKAFASIPGVTAVPYPHWETRLVTENDASQEFSAEVQALVSTLPAGPEASLDVISHLFNSIDEAPVRRIAARPPMDGARMSLQWHPIQAIQPDNNSGQIRSLSDDQFHILPRRGNPYGFIAPTANDSYSYIVAKQDGGVVSRQIGEGQRIIETKVDRQGRLWALTAVQPSLTEQVLTSCPVRISGNEAGSSQSDRCMQSTLAPSWQLDVKGNSYLYSESHMATEASFPERIMETRSGESVEMKWLWKDRSALTRRVFGNLHFCSKEPAPDLGDGLFWFASCGLVGVSPSSGGVVRSFPLKLERRERPVFGSAAGDWVVTEASDPIDLKETFRVHRLSTGKPAFEIPRRSGTHALARTAHGRLFAIMATGDGQASYVDVWRMKSDEHVSRLAIPEGITVKSLAFNRTGTELWIHADHLADNESGVLIWTIPGSLQDVADTRWGPDEAVIKRY